MNNEYLVATPPNDEPCPFHISLAGITYENPSYAIERRNSELLVVEYVISGSGTVCVDGKNNRANAGDMYIIPSYSSHKYFSNPANPWKKIWFNVEGTLCNELLRIYNLEKNIVFKHTKGYDYMKRMLSLCENKSLSSKEINTAATVIFMEIVLYLYELSSTNKTVSPEAEVLKKYIDVNIEKNITLDELSGLIFRSKSQTVRIFKNAYQKTPYDYLLAQKISRAKILLKNTSLSVKETAYALGFCDEHYFSNIFKKRTGVSPKVFRSSIS